MEEPRGTMNGFKSKLTAIDSTPSNSAVSLLNPPNLDTSWAVDQEADPFLALSDDMRLEPNLQPSEPSLPPLAPLRRDSYPAAATPLTGGPTCIFSSDSRRHSEPRAEVGDAIFNERSSMMNLDCDPFSSVVDGSGDAPAQARNPLDISPGPAPQTRRGSSVKVSPVAWLEDFL
jgi:hypothetical protein